MDNERPLNELVASENAKAHDACAAHHEKNVAYINRRQTRDFYWHTIRTALERNHKSIADADVCELGCGTGTFLDLVIESGCKQYCGVDISPRMIELAKAKCSDTRANFVLDTLSDFSARCSDSFDVILSSSFLHHLVDLDDGLVQIMNLLRPGGVYIALHEPVLPKTQSWPEKVDNFLQILSGTRHGELHFLKRAALAFCGYWRYSSWGKPIPYFDLLAFYARLKGHRPLDEESQIDLVDYQLNQPFSLCERVAEYGEVTPYTYLCYRELFPSQSLGNYEMLVMRK